MNIEDQAKRQLFDQDSFHIPAAYDPYRTNNILKDSNRPLENSQKTLLTNFHQESTQKKQNREDRKYENNNRLSLKKLLQRLQAMPSPEKKMKKNHNPKLTTVVQMMSSTQTSLIKKKTSVLVKTCNDQCFSLNQIQKQRILRNPVKNSVTLTPKMSSSCNKRVQQQLRIQKLIKKKLAQKQEWKLKNKTQKLINFLQSNNNGSECTKTKGFSTHSKFNSRKLINFLS